LHAWVFGAAVPGHLVEAPAAPARLRALVGLDGADRRSMLELLASELASQPASMNE
jgi:hypothetical protein